jgi:hypothetical protein
MKLLRIANDQIGQFFAACPRWAREFVIGISAQLQTSCAVVSC